MISEQFIWLGVAVNFLAGIGYVMATVRGQARPNRVSWGLWAVTAWLAFFGQLSEGVGMPALLTLTVALIPSLIFLASFVGGAYWEFSRLDITCGVFSLVTLVAWQLTASGLVAIVLSIAVDALAGVPTIVKAYREPESESHGAYTAGMFSAACTLLTLTEFTIATAAFAIYFFTLCATVSFLLLVTPRLRTRALSNSLRFPTTYPLPRQATDERLRDPFGPPVYRRSDRFVSAAHRPDLEGVRTYRGIPHIDLEVRVRIGQLAHGVDARVPVVVPTGAVDLGRTVSHYSSPGTVEGTVLSSGPGPEPRVSVPAQRTGGHPSVAVPAEPVAAMSRPTGAGTGSRASARPPTPHPAGPRTPVGGPTPQATGRPGADAAPADPTSPRVTVPGARPAPATERIRPGSVPAGPTDRVVPPTPPTDRIVPPAPPTDRVVPPPADRLLPPGHPAARPSPEPGRPAPHFGRPGPTPGLPPAAAARRERARYDHGLFDPRYEHGHRPSPPPFDPPAPPTRRRGSVRRALPVAAGTVAALGALAVAGVLLVDVRPMPSPGGQAAAVGVPPSRPEVVQVPAAPVGPIATSIAVPTVRAVVPVGATPGDVAVAPDGRTALIAHRAAGFVSVLDTSLDKVTATIAVPAGPPRFVAFSPDSSRAYITVFDDARTVSLVAVLDTTTDTLLTTIPVGQRPFAAAVTPDGSRLWVPSHDDARIDVVDTATNAVTTSIPVPASPHGVAFSADGSRAYVASHESNVVSVLDTASATPVATIPVGTSPQSAAVGDGQTAVANYDAGSVTIIDAAGAAVAEVPVGRTPQDVGYAPDGRYLYTANVEDDTVSVVDTAARAVTATIPVCAGPTSVAPHPTGRVAYVTCVDSGEVLIMDTTADQ
ncbi:hypothetical protein [Pseudonocardia humida]|uniref:YVTN family beta-propeller protein n=1 Tax=Pseudonocardia humida TaxID=2800819 RepID=A0ABT1A247_9PSEU|nr:hypothetical protein [Pseudonocardia humida]MCO1656884.1 hypothetical protein [Pseudonocardia humida]